MSELKSEEAAYQHTLPNVYTERITAVTILTIILISYLSSSLASALILVAYIVSIVYIVSLVLLPFLNLKHRVAITWQGERANFRRG